MFTNSKNHQGSRFFTKRYASKRREWKMKFIASTTNKEYGDVYIGFENRDEEFIKKGYYKINGGEAMETVDEVESEYPTGCTTIHFANSDVQELFRIW